ncbi:MAG: hypothetical protein CM15mV4_0290 [Caudoviricetes sp.]|nr:MAG: hypothetical protein CM15mV4_0290 [Caudoviricetes sp.]
MPSADNDIVSFYNDLKTSSTPLWRKIFVVVNHLIIMKKMGDQSFATGELVKRSPLIWAFNQP